MTNRESGPQRIQGAIFIMSLALSLTMFAAHAGLGWAASGVEANPWNASQVVEPAELAKAVSNESGEKPAVVCVGFDFLFRGAHIPGAAYAGPARDAKGLDALKKWASSIPRDHEVILYCGCCPLHQCPNVRPAFKALAGMGFKNVKVLYLPDNFQKDWVAKGYPVVKKGPDPVRCGGGHTL
ncbi:MAG: rhodanese-like domain-containing protein [Terriglobia bacterium]